VIGPTVQSGRHGRIFFILFGMVAGMILLPHLQRLAAQVRRRLDELDKTRGPSPWS
jgi:hypothetical protein